MSLIFMVIGLINMVGGIGLLFVGLTTAELHLIVTGSAALIGLSAAGSGLSMLVRHPFVIPLTWLAIVFWIGALFADPYLGLTEYCFRRDARPMWATIVIANYWALNGILILCRPGRDYLSGDAE